MIRLAALSPLGLPGSARPSGKPKARLAHFATEIMQTHHWSGVFRDIVGDELESDPLKNDVEDYLDELLQQFQRAPSGSCLTAFSMQ